LLLYTRTMLLLPVESSFLGLWRTISPSWHLSNACPKEMYTADQVEEIYHWFS
jgi:hypothetical protein